MIVVDRTRSAAYSFESSQIGYGFNVPELEKDCAIRDYFREMSVSEQLTDAMLRIDPEHARFLDDAALLITVCFPTTPLSAANTSSASTVQQGVPRPLRNPGYTDAMLPGGYENRARASEHADST
jgi:hypothetical protein